MLDANVLAPGFTSLGSASRRLIEHWEAGDYELVVSEHVLAELARTFDDPYYRSRISSQQVERSFTLSRTDALVTELTTPVIGVATHLEDDLILSTALSGGASLLCTRGKQLQLLKLRGYQTVVILSPGELLAREELANTFGVHRGSQSPSARRGVDRLQGTAAGFSPCGHYVLFINRFGALRYRLLALHGPHLIFAGPEQPPPPPGLILSVRSTEAAAATTTTWSNTIGKLYGPVLTSRISPRRAIA